MSSASTILKSSSSPDRKGSWPSESGDIFKGKGDVDGVDGGGTELSLIGNSESMEVS